MKTLLFFTLSLLIAGYTSIAQKSRKPQLEISASLEMADYYGDPLAGAGTQLKFLWPVGKQNNAITACIGVDRLFEGFHFDDYSYTFGLTSVGYRKGIKSFFIEPRIGFGVLHEEGYETYCGFIGIEPGVQKKKFSFSLDYRFISAEGFVEGDHYHVVAFRVGYRIVGAKK